MLGYKLISASENVSSDPLMSEVLSIPLIMRGEPVTALWNQAYTPSKPLWGGRTLSELLGLPVLSAMKPFSSVK